jgi:hypothetical protein
MQVFVSVPSSRDFTARKRGPDELEAIKLEWRRTKDHWWDIKVAKYRINYIYLLALGPDDLWEKN